MSGDYVYRTVAQPVAPPPPPMYNDSDPLISDLNDRSKNRRPFYVYVFNGGGSGGPYSHHQRRRLTTLFLYMAMLFLLVTMFILFITLFMTYSYNGHFRYMLLVRRWPPTICHATNTINGSNRKPTKDSCTPESRNYNKWVIHGLWPEFSDNTWEQYCNNEQLNMTLIEPLRAKLVQLWPNLLNGKTVESLWQHEWRKHGTCTHMSQYDYFNTTISLDEEYPLEERLIKCGIVPTNQHPYPRDLIEKALNGGNSSANGQHRAASHVLMCDHIGQQSYLREIYLCLTFNQPDHSTYCTMQSNCNPLIYYTPFQ